MLDRPSTKVEARKRLRIALEHWSTDRPDWRFAIRAMDHPDLIGWVCVRLARAGHTIEYWVAPGHRGKGHAKRAVAMAIRFAFCEQEVPSLRAEIVEPNDPSIEVVMSQGFAPTRTTSLIKDRAGNHLLAEIFMLTKASWLQERGCEPDSPI